MYSKRFLAFLPFVFEWECVYKKGHYGDMNYVTWEDEDGDPGGITKYGIDQRAHPHVDIKNLTQAQATEIYWTDYWTKYNCESYEDKLGEAYFNCCVNAGSGRAKILLARCNNKTGDEFITQQEKFYRNLVDEKPKFSKFLKGWLNRTTALRKTLGL
jgi:hypothetical protein